MTYGQIKQCQSQIHYVFGFCSLEKITIFTPMHVFMYVNTCAKETSINFFPTGAHMATFSWQFQHYGI